MFRILQQFILITILAVFSSQASAMFIQADWFEVDDPAVGTNRYAYSQNDPINLADPGGNVPYNPGGDTSTGWTDSSGPGENGNGRETYDSRTDRYSRDYLNQDGNGHHTIGEYNPERFSEDEYGSRSRKRSGVHSGFYDKNPGYRRAEQDAVNLDGSRNMGYARQAAGAVAGAAALATGAGEIVAATRIGSGLFSAGGLKYASRVRERALQDPVSHNFPYSFDKKILSTPPKPQGNGYNTFQKEGTMTGRTIVDPQTGVRTQTYKSGVFELGVRPDGVIDHRFFRPD